MAGRISCSTGTNDDVDTGVIVITVGADAVAGGRAAYQFAINNSKVATLSATERAALTSLEQKTATAAVEADARFLLKLEQDKFKGSHFLDRHGADTTLEQQLTRAQTGVAPDGYITRGGRLPDSSRFLTNQDQLDAMRIAQKEYAQSSKSAIDFDMGKSIGNGYFAEAGLNGVPADIQTTTKVRAIFRDGKLYTMFPLLR